MKHKSATRIQAEKVVTNKKLWYLTEFDESLRRLPEAAGIRCSKNDEWICIEAKEDMKAVFDEVKEILNEAADGKFDKHAFVWRYKSEYYPHSDAHHLRLTAKYKIVKKAREQIWGQQIER